MVVGLPVSIVMMAVAWWWLTRGGFKLKLDDGSGNVIGEELSKLGTISKAEKRVGIVFLLAALALALSEIRTRGFGWISWATLAGSVGMFVWFYPILGSMALASPDSFADWMWLDSWR